MAITLPHVYNQLTPSYKDIFIGSNTIQPFNLYNYGCLVMSLCSILNYYGHEMDPLTLNTLLVKEGGFVNGGEYVWGTLSRLYPGISERRIPTPTSLTNEQMAEIRKAIDDGYPVVVTLDYNPRTVERNDHYVVVTDYNPNDENDFTIVDPLGGRVVSMKEYLAWFKPSARATIEQYIIYSGPVPTEKQKPMDPQIAPTQTPQTQEVQAPPQTSGQVETNTVSVLKIDNERNVKMATQFKDMVSYLEIAKSPEDTTFEDCKRVIAGFKSRSTDLENKKIEAEKIAVKAQITIDNQGRMISDLNDEVLNLKKLHESELETIKKTRPNVEDLRKQYDLTYNELKGKYDEVLRENMTLRNNMAEKSVENAHESEKEQITVTYNKKNVGGIIKSILAFFTKIEK